MGPAGRSFAARVRAAQEPWLGFGTGTGHRVVVLATFPAATLAALATSGAFGERFAAATPFRRTPPAVVPRGKQCAVSETLQRQSADLPRAKAAATVPASGPRSAVPVPA
jgi:hypothetical protein